MASTNQDFTMYEGNSKKIHVTLTEADGTPVNLLGSTIRWGMKKNVYESTLLVTKTNSSGILTDVDLATGKFTISLSSADTIGYTGVFYHEAELIDSLNNVTTIMSGSITIQKAGL